MESYQIGKFLFETERPSQRFHEILVSVHLVHEPGQSQQTLRGTAVGLVSPQGLLYVGVAVCSESENFDKRRGRQRAFGLACQEVFRFNPAATIDFFAEDAFRTINACLRKAIELEKAGILSDRENLAALKRERFERKLANLVTKRMSA